MCNYIHIKNYLQIKQSFDLRMEQLSADQNLQKNHFRRWKNHAMCVSQKIIHRWSNYLRMKQLFNLLLLILWPAGDYSIRRKFFVAEISSTCKSRFNHNYDSNRDIFSQKNQVFQPVWSIHCMKSVRIQRYSGPYSVRMQENTDQDNSEYGHFWRIDTNAFFLTS